MMKEEHYLLTIKAENRPNLLHLITGILNKKLISVIGLTSAPTDISEILLVTIEVSISGKALQPLLLKLGNIIEVFAVEAIRFDKALCLRSAYFKMDKAVLTSPQVSVINKWGAQIIDIHAKTVLIGKSGSESVIRELYNALDGTHLKGFSQTGMIANSNLIDNDEVGRVIGLIDDKETLGTEQIIRLSA
jgi:acetolactate synthase small subunit